MNNEHMPIDNETTDRRLTRLEIKDEEREKELEGMKRDLSNLSGEVQKIGAKQDANYEHTNQSLDRIESSMAPVVDHFSARKILARWFAAVVAIAALIAGLLGMNYQWPWVKHIANALGMAG